MLRYIAILVVALLVLPASLAGALLPCSMAAGSCQMPCCAAAGPACHTDGQSTLTGSGCGCVSSNDHDSNALPAETGAFVSDRSLDNTLNLPEAVAKSDVASPANTNEGSGIEAVPLGSVPVYLLVCSLIS